MLIGVRSRLTGVEFRLIATVFLHFICVTDHRRFEVALSDEVDQSTNEQECNLNQSTKISEEFKQKAYYLQSGSRAFSFYFGV